MNHKRRDEAANDYATRQVSFYHQLCRDEFSAGWNAAMSERDAEIKELIKIFDMLEPLVSKHAFGFDGRTSLDRMWL